MNSCYIRIIQQGALTELANAIHRPWTETMRWMPPTSAMADRMHWWLP